MVPVSFPQYIFTLISAHINIKIFLHHHPEYYDLPPARILVLSTQAHGGKRVLLFSFSGANQLLIALNPIDLLPPLSP